MNKYFVIQDPNTMSSMYSNKEEDIEDLIDRKSNPGLDVELDLNQELSVGVQSDEILSFDDIEKYLDRIPKKEADIIKLYYKDRMKQEQIARLFNVTQAAISYRLDRGVKRIQFLRTIPELYIDQFEEEMGELFDDENIVLMWNMYKTTSQSVVAKMMGLTQGRVRNKFFKNLEILKERIEQEANKTAGMYRKSNPEAVDIDVKDIMSDVVVNSKFAKYYKVFYSISDRHFNILHEVSLPQFSEEEIKKR